MIKAHQRMHTSYCNICSILEAAQRFSDAPTAIGTSVYI